MRTNTHARPARRVSTDLPFDFGARRTKTALRRETIIVRAVALAILVSLVLGIQHFWWACTFTAPLQYKRWWKKVGNEVYRGRLTDHDKSVVEEIALREHVTPARVIATLAFQPVTPNDGHLENWDEDEQRRFGRIVAINYHFFFHRGVCYRLLHNGEGSPFQGLLGGSFARDPEFGREMLEKDTARLAAK